MGFTGDRFSLAAESLITVYRICHVIVALGGAVFFLFPLFCQHQPVKRVRLVSMEHSCPPTHFHVQPRGNSWQAGIGANLPFWDT
ncbi:hypothetical protein GDO81_025791 [Engystomops pustulosus]|uniref:Uncharacterized protein n=1 Tax=Engystomops pustulosus TaxID=76066 RepID=A0AAV6YRU1_ENGPU|nr:hypothetical protein GDO81_025791 [Engystomops pustulosus]